MPLLLKTVPAARGPRWIGDAFRLFVRRPFGFTMMFVVFLFSALVAGLVPLAGGLLQMMSLPLMSLGFMVAAQSALLDGPVRPTQFLEPLRTDARRRRALLILCLIYGLGALGILLLVDAVSNQAWQRLQLLLASADNNTAQVQAVLAEPGLATGMLLGVLLASVLSVPFWHAPALVHWGGQGVQQALFSSTVALWRSKGAIFTYLMAWVAVLMLFSTAAAVLVALLGAPQLAGLLGLPAGLVFSSVFYISVLFMFNDSFGGAAAASAAAAPPA